MTKGKIPDRWEDYEAVGKLIKGTRFIAFKVPLSQYLSRFLPDGVKRFTPQDLTAIIRQQNLDLGLVVDLTNTTRYYRKEDIFEQGIGYEKIFTEGHRVPSKTVQDKFSKAVDKFLNSNENSDRVIGVHCTHGLNRTGYLICRYMIDRMNIKAEDAINAFNEARGHAMERQNYLSDLLGEPSAELQETEEEHHDHQIERKRLAPVDESSEAATLADRKRRCTNQSPATTIDDHNLQYGNSRNGGRFHQDYGHYNHYHSHYFDRSTYNDYSHYQHQSNGYHPNSYHAGGRMTRQWDGYNRDDYNADGHNFTSDHEPTFYNSRHWDRSYGQQSHGWGQTSWDNHGWSEYGRFGHGAQTNNPDHGQPRRGKSWRRK